MTKPDKTVDLKGEVCPYTLVKSKLALEDLSSGQLLEILFDHKPAVINVPRSLQDEGHSIVDIEKTGENNWRVLVRHK